MTIILDAGTTTYELATLLANSSLKNICVITNDLYIALELYQKEDIKKVLEQVDINSYFLGATLEEVVDILVD